MGLFRVVSQPAASPVSEQSPSLKLGAAGAGAKGGAVVAPFAARTKTPSPAAKATRPAQSPAGAAAAAQPVTKPITGPVVVVNASGITGLAGRTATLLRERGVSVAAIGNLNPAAGQRPTTRTVFYPPGGRGQAQTLAILSDAPAVAPAPHWLQTAGRLVLVLTDAKLP